MFVGLSCDRFCDAGVDDVATTPNWLRNVNGLMWIFVKIYTIAHCMLRHGSFPDFLLTSSIY